MFFQEINLKALAINYKECIMYIQISRDQYELIYTTTESSDQ